MESVKENHSGDAIQGSITAVRMDQRRGRFKGETALFDPRTEAWVL